MGNDTVTNVTGVNTAGTSTDSTVSITPKEDDGLRVRRSRAEAVSRETRNFAAKDVELRQEGDGLTLAGYASIFDVEYDVFGGPPFGWVESVEEGAFDKTLREKADVQLLVNHEGPPLARTKSGTLILEADNLGLRTEASLEPTDPDVQRLAPKMRRKDLDEMSFAFRVIRQEWDEEYTRRKILEVDLNRGDVSIVNYGANPATSAQLRAAEVLSALTTIDAEELLAEVRSMDSTDLLKRAHETLTQLLEPQTQVPILISKREHLKRELELLSL